jgi:hypothetical protein
MPTVTIADLYGKTGDASKPIANIPTGLWKIRGIRVTARDVTKTNSDGEEYPTTEFLTSAEPLEPVHVDPDELAQVDEQGRPVYAGKRLFLRSTLSFRNEMQQFDAMTAAMGIPVGTSRKEIVERNMVKGKIVFGAIYNREYKRNDGSDGTEQKVRSWAASEGSQAFTL